MFAKSSILRHKAVFGGAIVLVVLVIGVLEFTNVTHFFHDQKVETISQYTKGEPKTSTSDTSNSGSSQAANDQDQSSKTNTATSDAPLVAPNGQFVSNHRPGQDGSPTSEQSVCNTTPGATCSIQFTSNGVTKSLSAKVADAGGSAYWNWSLKDIGLTSGSWAVSATATLGSKSLTAKDAMNLEVSQ